MGFFDMVGGVIGGVKDVVGGGGEFLYDTAKAGVTFVGDPKEGLSMFMDTLQEDLLGQVVGGAFGPDGIIGSVIEELPEEFRKPFRTVLEPTMEAWDWSIQNLVDRPLGTVATVINATKLGTNISELFDGSTWATAWEINDKRTFGQSVAAAMYNIDPFDDEAYNEIRDNDLFNLVSGTADFFQEFVDPAAILLGGSVNIARGKTVFATKDGATIVGRSNFEKMGGVLAPQKIYTPGGGIFRKNLLGKERLTDAQIGARAVAGEKFVTQRVDSYLDSPNYTLLEEEMAKVTEPYITEFGGFDAAGVLDPKSAKEAVNQRFAVLRQVTTRKGSKMPEDAAFMIASGATPEARKLNARLALGDVSVLEDAAGKAKFATKLLDSEDYLTLVDRHEELLQMKGLGIIDPEGVVELAETGKQIAERSKDLTNVDWSTMFDGYLGLLESQSRRAVDVSGNPTTGWVDIANTNEHLQSITEMTLRKIVGLDMMDATAVKAVGEAGGQITKVYSDPFNKLFNNRKAVMLQKGDKEFMYDEYAIRSVITPLKVRKFRVFTERLPQALVDFSDNQAFTQWERMLQQASRVDINGTKIISKREINNLLGEWTRISSKTGYDAVELKILFESTVDKLAKKADETMAKQGIKVEEKLIDTLRTARTMKEGVTAKTKNAYNAKSRRSLSVDESRQSTHYTFIDPNTNVPHTVISGMSPQQMRQSGIVPRWDLINTEIKRKYNRNGNAYRKTIQGVGDAAQFVTKGSRSVATSAMQVWRPLVLLTPKWPMRVQLDETLRRAADLGVISEMRNLIGGIGDMRDVYATWGVNMKLDDVTNFIMDTANKGKEVPFEHMGDALRHLETTGVEIKDLLKQHADTIKINEGKLANYVPNFAQGIGSRAGIARGALGAALLGPTAGLAWAAMYGARRYQRVRNVSKRRAGLAVADSLQFEAKQLLNEALANADDGLRQQAETMLARADGMREAVDAITPEGAKIDDIVDNLEKAHMLMDEAGMANLSIGGATIRNAYGDTADFREIISQTVSSTKNTSSLVQGVKQAQERQILRHFDADWEVWDITKDDAVTYRKGWDNLLGRSTDKGIRSSYPEFYEIIWSTAPKAERVVAMQQLLKGNQNLRNRIGNLDDLKYHPTPEVANFTQKAADIIDEFDDILPAELSDLRAKAARGENVTWSEVEKELRARETKRVEDHNRFAKDNNVGLEPGDEGYVKLITANEDIGALVSKFRDDYKIDNFGKSTSPNMKTVDYGRGPFTGEMGEKIENLFKLLGETPADQLSRNPYFRTKYEREVNRRLALYTDKNGNVNISQRNLQKIEDQSRKSALGETRDLLYDLAEETRFAEMTANIMPFFNAWQEVLGRWAKLGTENPYFVGKMINLYQKPWNAELLGMEEVYQYDEAKIAARSKELGKELTEKEKKEFVTSSYIVFRLPQPVKDIAGVLTPGPLAQTAIDNDIRFSKEGLASMLQSTTPGFGPLVSIPIRQAVLEDPSLEQTFKFMFPYGHPEGNFFEQTFASFAPAYAQNLRNTFMETPTKKRVVSSFFQQVLTEYEMSTPGGISGLLADEQWVMQRVREAEERAEQFFIFRTAAGLFSPTSTTVLSPYADLMQTIKDLQRKHGFQEGNAIFLEEHGDEFVYLTSRLTKLNDGVAASAVSEEAYIKYGSLVQAHPEIGAWVTKSLGGKDEEYLFNQAAYRRQTQMDVSPLTPGVKRRELKTPIEIAESVDVSEGWTKYIALNDFIRSVQDERQAVGLPYSLNSNAMAAFQKFKRDEVAKIRQEHPLWGEAWDANKGKDRIVSIIDGFVTALGDENYSELILTRPSSKHLVDYFKLRGFVEQELIRRAEEQNGSLNLESKTNSDLLLFWETEKQELSMRPEFSVVYDRYFENDMIPANSFVSVLKG